MPHAKFHDLRHYHASCLILIEKKTSLEVAARLGHSNPSFTIDTYTHLFDKQRTLITPKQQNTALSLLKSLEGEANEEDKSNDFDDLDQAA